MEAIVRPRLFAIAVNVLTLAAPPAAGAALLSHASQRHSASVAISPGWVQPRLTTMTLFRYFRTTLANREAVQRSLLTNIAMTPANVQWDMPAALAFDTMRGGGGAVPKMIDAIDAAGRHYSGYSDSCAPKAGMVAHCTLSYPDARGHAPWATIVLRVTPAGDMDPITLTIHPG